MVCPWAGETLPFVDINLESSVGCRAELELTFELSVEFIRYMMALRAPPEVSD